MSSGDKYAKARSLSKLFDEFLSRHSGDHESAKRDMDDKIGPSWMIEIQHMEKEDQGSDFLPDEVDRLAKDIDADMYEEDEMLKKARKFSEKFAIQPDANLRNDVIRPREGQKDDKCVSEILRDLADALEK